MSFAGILILAFTFVLLGMAAGIALFVRFLTGEAEADEAMRFDPFARPQPQPSRKLMDFILFLRSRPKQIGSRRDRRGRFRKL